MISTDKGPDMGLVSDHRNLRKLRELGQGNFNNDVGVLFTECF